MIEDVVNSILEAEDVAQKKIEAAKQEAAEIIGAAEAAADRFKKEMYAQNKAAFADGVKKVEEKASAVAQTVLSELNTQAEAEMALLEKNVNKAVNIILEKLK